MQGSVIFLQDRTHLGGATRSLANLVRHPLLRPWHPVLVSGNEGWLTKVCRQAGIPVVVQPFPGSRSLSGRLWRNDLFAEKVLRRLRAAGLWPVIVHANDHSEGLLGIALAQRANARTCIFLRSSGMSREDFRKYRCAEFDRIIAVGDELQQRAQTWAPGHVIRLIYDGVTPAEYAPPKPRSGRFPERILVLGSASPSKGWSDLLDALFLLHQAGELPHRQWDFTGDEPEGLFALTRLQRLKLGQFNFLGRVERFGELVRQYDLAIQASRRESFGLAAIETLFAGVPLLSTRVGVIERVLEAPEFLVPPAQPLALANALRRLMREWDRVDPGVERAQRKIRDQFLVDYAAARLTRTYAELQGKA